MGTLNLDIINMFSTFHSNNLVISFLYAFPPQKTIHPDVSTTLILHINKLTTQNLHKTHANK